jgi:hypothetical protein
MPDNFTCQEEGTDGRYVNQTTVQYLRVLLYYFTPSNARQFYSSSGECYHSMGKCHTQVGTTFSQNCNWVHTFTPCKQADTVMTWSRGCPLTEGLAVFSNNYFLVILGQAWTVFHVKFSDIICFDFAIHQTIIANVTIIASWGTKIPRRNFGLFLNLDSFKMQFPIVIPIRFLFL